MTLALRRPPSVHRRLAWALPAVLLCGACGGGGDKKGAAAAPAPAQAPAVAVRVAKVGTASAAVLLRASGSFFPEDTVTVAAKVAGRVDAIGPEVGDTVTDRALLARVEEADYVLVRNQRAQHLQEALTKLGLTALPKGDVDFERLPSVEQARLQAANAKERYERAVRLDERTPGGVSVQDIADLRSAWELAESALRGVRLTARTDLAQARTRAAELAVAEKNVADATVSAPEGRWTVAARLVAQGDYVSVGDALYRLLDTDPLRLVVNVPERRMQGVTKGRPATVTSATTSDTLQGTVLRVRPEVDLRTRTYDVEIEVPNPDGRIAVGTFAVVEIHLGDDPSVPVVPGASVIRFAGVAKVFVPKDGKAEEQRVTTGREMGENVEIVEGLKAGDSYVVDPPSDLVAGARITVGDTPATSR
jgi:RND family efflux transporter MFP subunit